MSCTKKVDTKKAEKLIKNFIEKGLEGKTAVVTCPDEVKIEKDSSFDCTAKVDDHDLTITVTQQDAEGTVAWEVTKGLVEMTLGEGTEGLIRQYIENNIGHKDAKVECPETIEVGKDKEFSCTAIIDGVTVTAGVKQQDDKGNVTYGLTGGILSSEKLNVLIQGAIKAKNVDATINCGAPMRLSKPGGTFECTAVDEKGVSAKIAVTIKDQDGNVEWEIVEVPAK